MRDREGRKRMNEKVIFKERKRDGKRTTAVRISEDNHRKIHEISKKTNMPVYAVADRLLVFALERDEWKD